MTGTDGLLACIGELERVDEAIAEATHRRDTPALLEAIEARAPVAAALLEAIAEDDRRQQARLGAAAARGRETSGLVAWLEDRDRVMEALAGLVDARTREYNRILREIAAGRRWR
ncbi:MAG: hypothetical protein GXY82_06865 [Methanospirillum sp.]|nr:hypothetical protein [Methanospirillum sp.]